MAFKTVATNKKARFNYKIQETFEAGIELKGTEVKSIRKSKVNLSQGYVSVDNNECYLKQVNISPYDMGNIFNVDSMRVRKLLLHKKQINYLMGQSVLQGYSIIPLSMYLKNGLVKVEIALCIGKKDYDKRHDIAKRDANIKMQRAKKEFNNKNY